MAKKTRNGEVNKSQAVREVLTENPHYKASEVVATLAGKGIVVTPGLVHFIKGKIKEKKGRRKKARQMVKNVTATMGMGNAVPTSTSDVVATIIKVKHLASELGGLKKLKALVEALSD